MIESEATVHCLQTWRSYGVRWWICIAQTPEFTRLGFLSRRSFLWMHTLSLLGLGARPSVPLSVQVHVVAAQLAHTLCPGMPDSPNGGWIITYAVLFCRNFIWLILTCFPAWDSFWEGKWLGASLRRLACQSTDRCRPGGYPTLFRFGFLSGKRKTFQLPCP